MSPQQYAAYKVMSLDAKASFLVRIGIAGTFNDAMSLIGSRRRRTHKPGTAVVASAAPVSNYRLPYAD